MQREAAGKKDFGTNRGVTYCRLTQRPAPYPEGLKICVTSAPCRLPKSTAVASANGSNHLQLRRGLAERHRSWSASSALG